MEQVLQEKSPDENQDSKKTQPGKRGRPSVRGNKNHQPVELSPYLQLVQTTLKNLLNLVGCGLSLVYASF